MEDMLRACALEMSGSWDENLSLVEFAYNNSYHASIEMTPFKALYGRTCCTPLYWDEVGERCILGPELIQKTCEKVDLIKEKIKATQSRQKSYVDRRRQHIQFKAGEKAFLKMSPIKGGVRFGKRGKLNPRYIGPFEIIARVGAVAYQLALAPSLAGVHDVFHVSMLRQYIPDASHLLPQQPTDLIANLSYEEVPEEIVDRREHNLRNQTISFVKVWWSNHSAAEASWEREDLVKERYPYLFNLPGSNSQTMVASMLWAASVKDTVELLDTPMEDSEDPSQFTLLESENPYETTAVSVAGSVGITPPQDASLTPRSESSFLVVHDAASTYDDCAFF
ncbi:uncharacterized protein LOC122655300 [Telopea speciosissima]|uniref:uncharacterized protein LOC122655300 n=1 Tax=Telopea speciosissima TaxID=54955 RepID=UPI001CC37246|nr:uncharacterized protein LOC122655300 [Telopea speciosissima]